MGVELVDLGGVVPDDRLGNALRGPGFPHERDGGMSQAMESGSHVAADAGPGAFAGCDNPAGFKVRLYQVAYSIATAAGVAFGQVGRRFLVPVGTVRRRAISLLCSQEARGVSMIACQPRLTINPSRVL